MTHRFVDLPNLASARLGATVAAANDEFFAAKENLVRDEEPVWKPDLYTDRGKWMDGWETRRRREEGHDWCLIRLGVPGVLRGIVVDTSHFTGNYPESCSLEAAAAPPGAPVESLLDDGTEWIEIVPRTPLAGDARQPFAVSSPYRFTHLRFHIYPDGGVARLRAHGEPLAAADLLPPGESLVLSALERGGRVVAVSDSFFGPADRLLLSDPPTGMDDGWETRRRRGAGNDWVIVRLAAGGRAERIEVDTTFFKGNAPGSCSVEAVRLRSDEDAGLAEGGRGVSWLPLLTRTPLQPDHPHQFEALPVESPITHVRLQIYPDGGVARFRVHGRLDPTHRSEAMLVLLNALPPAAARDTLLQCCGSRRWADAVAGRRPYADPGALLQAAEEAAALLAPEDWREAFASHPPIDGGAADSPRGAQATAWSQQEQADVEGRDRELRDRLAEANRLYRERFGHTFVVRATGRSGEEMLRLLEERLDNDPEEELAVAAGEEIAITRLRLEKLIGPIPERGEVAS